jgi:hypothetical protein
VWGRGQGGMPLSFPETKAHFCRAAIMLRESIRENKFLMFRLYAATRLRVIGSQALIISL